MHDNVLNISMITTVDTRTLVAHLRFCWKDAKLRDALRAVSDYVVW